MMTLRRWPILALLLAATACGPGASEVRTHEPVAPAAAPANDLRPDDWAKPVQRPGLPNLHRIDAGFYRGAQPTAEGIAELQRLGVRTIVCLRAHHSDQDLLGGTKMSLEHIPMSASNLKEEDVVRFLRIAADPNRRPVFVHCQHGADRTGAMCAAYRVVVQGWSKQKAIDEMTQGGFHFHAIWTNIPKFIEGLDVAKIRGQVRIEPREPARERP